jgi:hypothetical protein
MSVGALNHRTKNANLVCTLLMQAPPSPSVIKNTQLKKPHDKNLAKEVFEKIGYFFYDFFLMVRQLAQALTNSLDLGKLKSFIKFITKYEAVIEPFFIMVESLCLLSNIYSDISEAIKKKLSVLETTLRVIGKGSIGLVFGLLLPKQIMDGFQKFFKAKTPLEGVTAGVLALLAIELAIEIGDKFIDAIAHFIDKTFSKRSKHGNIS